MDHREVRDILEEVATEPSGLERLLGADTHGAASLSAHLAGCAACRAELDALRRSVAAIRDAVQELPRPELREQTLEFVARVGRPRGIGNEGQKSIEGGIPVGAHAQGRRWWPSLPGAMTFAAGMAAAVAVAAVVVWSGVEARLSSADAAIADQRSTIAGLATLADWTLRFSGDADASRVSLEAPDGGAQVGSVLVSSKRDELVMVARGLPIAPEGQEYRCWVEASGERVAIGRMYRAGALAYWVGSVDDSVADGEDLTFGVSLEASGSDTLSGEAILMGGA